MFDKAINRHPREMTSEIQIEGMGCDHCITAVRDALQTLDGVTVEKVELGAARVQIDPSRASLSQAEAAIREAGYQPTSVTEGA